MVRPEYILGAGYGLSLWLITSGIIRYLKEPKTFSFVLKKDTLSPVPEEKLPEEVRAYKDWLEESFKRSVLEKTRKSAVRELLAGFVLLAITLVVTLAMA
ncbi:hypothetical protein [Thermococcus sp.]|uniref:hypothetical protein n=1 Tax=Thermococcus sp. TaxID=35749 RepID=UPI002636AA99|nr:hypothetical protein [Thermococcus sp.]